MRDWWHDITKKLLDHSRYTIIGTILGLIMAGSLVGFAGCQSRTLGLGGERVNRMELAAEVINSDTDIATTRAEIEAATAVLNVEIEARNQRATQAIEDLDRQDLVKVQVIEAVSLIGQQAASGTPVNWLGLIPMATTVLLGAAVGGFAKDNLRKDRKIAKGTFPPSEPTP